MNEAFRKWWAGSCQHLYGKHAAWEAWQEATPKWQPIETAPKDGTDILGLWQERGRYFRKITWWSDKLKGWTDDIFISPDDDEFPTIPIPLTHWQPLPETKQILLNNNNNQQE